jgi:hypothetical protein
LRPHPRSQWLHLSSVAHLAKLVLSAAIGVIVLRARAVIDRFRGREMIAVGHHATRGADHRETTDVLHVTIVVVPLVVMIAAVRRGAMIDVARRAGIFAAGPETIRADHREPTIRANHLANSTTGNPGPVVRSLLNQLQPSA